MAEGTTNQDRRNGITETLQQMQCSRIMQQHILRPCTQRYYKLSS